MSQSVQTSQPLPRRWTWLLIVPLVVGALLALQVGRPGRTGDLSLLGSSVATTASGQRMVTGSVRNNSDEQLSHVQLDIDMLAADGTLLATAYSSTTNLPAGATWTFETPVPFGAAARFRITRLACRRDGETSSLPCSPADTVEVGRSGP
jgi:hypothetical protein